MGRAFAWHAANLCSIPRIPEDTLSTARNNSHDMYTMEQESALRTDESRSHCHLDGLEGIVLSEIERKRQTANDLTLVQSRKTQSKDGPWWKKTLK